MAVNILSINCLVVIVQVCLNTCVFLYLCRGEGLVNCLLGRLGGGFREQRAQEVSGDKLTKPVFTIENNQAP